MSELERSAAGRTRARPRSAPGPARGDAAAGERWGCSSASAAGAPRSGTRCCAASVEKSVSDKLRAEIHAAAFRFYRAATGIDDAVRLARLASHAARRGLPKRGGARLPGSRRPRAPAPPLRRGGVAVQPRRWASSSRTSVRQRMVALRGRGFMRYRMSRHDAVDDLTAALEFAAQRLEDREAEVEIVLEMATALDWMVEYPPVDASWSPRPRRCSTTLDRARTISFGRRCWSVRDARCGAGQEADRATEKLREALAMAEPLGDQAYEIRVDLSAAARGCCSRSGARSRKPSRSSRR